MTAVVDNGFDGGDVRRRATDGRLVFLQAHAGSSRSGFDDVELVELPVSHFHVPLVVQQTTVGVEIAVDDVLKQQSVLRFP